MSDSSAEDILGEVQELLASRESVAARKKDNNQNINNKRRSEFAAEGGEEGEVEELLAGKESIAARKKNNQNINNKRTAE